MATVVYRNGIEFSPTTIQIPTELKSAAKDRKISLSALLIRALKAEIGEVAA